MERLVVYTSIDGEITSKVVKFTNPHEYTQYLLKIPQGRVLLHKEIVRNSGNSSWTEIWVETGKEGLCNRDDIIEKAYKVYSFEGNNVRNY